MSHEEETLCETLQRAWPLGPVISCPTKSSKLRGLKDNCFLYSLQLQQGGRDLVGMEDAFPGGPHSCARHIGAGSRLCQLGLLVGTSVPSR